MVTIETDSNGQRFINCKLKGGTAEYVHHLHALAASIPPAPEETRNTLSEMLIAMLPQENQLNIEK